MFKFSPEYNIVTDGELFIKLSPKEAEILKILLSETGKIFKFEDFGVSNDQEKAALRTCVNRLNKKLSKYVRIASVSKEGYFITHIVEG